MRNAYSRVTINTRYRIRTNKILPARWTSTAPLLILLATVDMFFVSMVLPCPECHKREALSLTCFTEHSAFEMCSCCYIHEKFSPFYSLAVPHCGGQWVCSAIHCFNIIWSISGVCLFLFVCFLAITSTAAINICIQVLRGLNLLVHLDKHQGVG